MQIGNKEKLPPRLLFQYKTLRWSHHFHQFRINFIALGNVSNSFGFYVLNFWIWQLLQMKRIRILRIISTIKIT